MTNGTRARDVEHEHDLDLHKGEALFAMAGTYDTLLLTTVEAVQNAIDASASCVFVGFNRQRSQLIVIDDGNGVTTDEFKQALRSVGKGIKDASKLGRFGRGLISPLGKCARFTFTSAPIDGEFTNQWTFVSDKIRAQKETVRVPYRQLTTLPAVPQPFTTQARGLHASWRTMVQLFDVTKDRVISAIEVGELAGHIRAKLGRAMRKNNTVVHVAVYDAKDQLTTTAINPLEFTGEALPRVTYTDEEFCGEVTFELYRAANTGSGRRGEVLVMQRDDNYPIMWKEFNAQAMGSRWRSADKDLTEAFVALGSGFFEGVIYAEHIELDPERTKFVLNQALQSLYIVLYRWYTEHGRDLYAQERESRRDDRYVRLGEQVLEELYAGFLGDVAFDSIEPYIAAEPEPKPPKPRDAAPGKKRPVAKPPGSKERQGKDTSPRPGPKPPTRKKMLSFAFEAMPQSPFLWSFDHETGELTFNIIHPEWVKCDEGPSGKRTSKHDRQVKHLEKWIALELLMLLTQHPEPEAFDSMRSIIDRKVKPFVAALILE